jgi:hypothetical protein
MQAFLKKAESLLKENPQAMQAVQRMDAVADRVCNATCITRRLARNCDSHNHDMFVLQVNEIRERQKKLEVEAEAEASAVEAEASAEQVSRERSRKVQQALEQVCWSCALRT